MTPDRFVVDASVLGAAFFNEADSEKARAFLRRGPSLIAPDLLQLQIAEIAAGKIRRQEASIEVARRATDMVTEFVQRLAPTGVLTTQAFDLVARHQMPIQDAVYLALAEAEGCTLVTLDQSLARAASAAGLGALVQPLEE
ncbi:type II toxin-antitoxin system VapC family toxin [Brevundimonas faecalis]|uniref:Nucleic acid-binding protein n=1 Tax=Brevundimonas faecalis TaxID=947378 RepID=A0ABV2R9I9_9CAUL